MTQIYKKKICYTKILHLFTNGWTSERLKLQQKKTLFLWNFLLSLVDEGCNLKVFMIYFTKFGGWRL